jgi:hypothetical protein
LVSRTRTWLGVDEEGRHYLETVPGHGADRLQLSQAVTTDWAEFARAMSAARDQRRDEASSRLDAAMGLIRGRPFLGVDPTRYVWAERPMQEMVSMIADAARMAAEINIERGNYGRGRDLALRGLEVVGVDDRLAEIAMRASYLEGDPAAARRIADRHERLLDELEEIAPVARRSGA